MEVTNMFTSLLLIIELNKYFVSSQNPIESSCFCDLTLHACDVNCCCDAECNAQERGLFSHCIKSPIRSDSRVCVREGFIVINNTNTGDFITDHGLLCLVRDNYPQRNLYSSPKPIYKQEEFLKYSLNQTNSFVSSGQLDLQHRKYQINDPISVVHRSNSAETFLILPGPSLIGQYCSMSNIVRLFRPKTTTCLILIDDLAKKCQTKSEWDSKTYYEEFDIPNQPKVPLETMDRKGIDPVTPDADSTGDILATSQPSELFIRNLMPVTLTGSHDYLPNHSMINITASNQKLPPVVFDKKEGICKYAVKKVRYTFIVNASNGISKTTLQLVMDQINVNESYFELHTEVDFVWDDESPEKLRRSGNPGYLMGEPVMAGRKVQKTNETFLVSMELDRNAWMTSLSSVGDSTCAFAKREPILFGINSMSGCLIELTSSLNQQECQRIQKDVIQLLNDSFRDVIGSFANASVEQPSDWIDILHDFDNVGKQVTSRTIGECSSVVMGLDVEIIYAQTGSWSNPQARILGAQYKFRPPQNLHFYCIGPYCQKGSEKATQRVPVIQTVTFTDITRPASPAVAKVPSIDARLPFDFFYPFSGINGVKRMESTMAMVILSTVGMVLD